MSKNVFNIFGVIAVLGAVVYAVLEINKRTETRIASDEALNDLQDKNKLNELNKTVSNYHRNNSWVSEEIEASVQ